MITEDGRTIITKQDERNALAKIRKIVEGLGERSYVATAFDGAFDLAEWNIDDDAAFSVKELLEQNSGYIDLLNENETKYACELEKIRNECDKAKNSAEVWESKYHSVIDNFDNVENRARQDYTRAVENEGKLEKAQNEIIQLKAKLYDLMTAGKEKE